MIKVWLHIRHLRAVVSGPVNWKLISLTEAVLLVCVLCSFSCNSSSVKET